MKQCDWKTGNNGKTGNGDIHRIRITIHSNFRKQFIDRKHNYSHTTAMWHKEKNIQKKNTYSQKHFNDNNHFSVHKNWTTEVEKLYTD